MSDEQHMTCAGDFNLGLLDELLKEPKLKMINTCNELNAGYAADGCARVKGEITSASTNAHTGQVQASASPLALKICQQPATGWKQKQATAVHTCIHASHLACQPMSLETCVGRRCPSALIFETWLAGTVNPAVNLPWTTTSLHARPP